MLGREGRGWTESTRIVMKFNFRAKSISSLPNEVNIALGNAKLSRDPQCDAIDSLPKPDDFIEWLRMTEQFEVGFRPDQADLSCPSQKRLPVEQKLVELGG